MEQRSYIKENVRRIISEVQEEALRCDRDPKDIQIMAVTKTVPPELVNQAIEAGVSLLGENKAQELLDKYDSYQKGDHPIHFIGHLQTNKVRQIIDKVSMIESVDSIHLAEEINRQAEARDIIMPVLVEINIGREPNKSGILPENWSQIMEKLTELSHLRVSGLMSIPPFCEKARDIHEYFCQIHQLFIDIRRKNVDNIFMEQLSMGMSQDYLAAIRHGSTILRIGTAIFGKRDK